MAKIKQVIELIEENPFRSIDDLSEKVGLEKNELISALNDNNIDLTELKSQAEEQMFQALPDDFSFNFSEMFDIDGDDK